MSRAVWGTVVDFLLCVSLILAAFNGNTAMAVASGVFIITRTIEAKR